VSLLQSGQAHTCASCGGEIQGEAAFCPSCGAAAPRVGADEAGAGVEKQLAAANLARIRKNWEEAIRLCLEALAADPDNADAHTLLGDIYHDQGRVEEAAVWYQMALDLDPGNASLRKKLEREKAVLKARRGKPAPPPPDDADGGESRLERFVRGEGYRSLINIITLVLAGLALIVLIALVIRQLGGDGAVETADTSPVPSVAGRPQERSGQGGAPEQTQAPAPYSPPPAAGSPGASTTPPRTQPPPAPQSPGTAGPELAFLQRLRAQSDIWLGGSPDAVWSDPRNRSITVSVTWQGTATSADRVRILRQAKEVARAAFALEPQAARVAVRVLADLPDFAGATTSRQIAFMGEIFPAEANRGMDENADADTWERLFTGVYWHPLLRPGA